MSGSLMRERWIRWQRACWSWPWGPRHAWSSTSSGCRTQGRAGQEAARGQEPGDRRHLSGAEDIAVDFLPVRAAVTASVLFWWYFGTCHARRVFGTTRRSWAGSGNPARGGVRHLRAQRIRRFLLGSWTTMRETGTRSEQESVATSAAWRAAASAPVDVTNGTR